MILSYLTHKKWIFEENGLKIIATQSPIAYRDIVQGFQGENKILVCSNNNYDPLEIDKTFDLVGDPLLSGDLTKKYMLKIVNHLVENMDETTRNQILTAFSKLELVLSDSLLLEDLPLVINFDEDLKKLFKMLELHINQDVIHVPYAIIETVLKIHRSCNLKTIPVFCNVAHYLNNQELTELSKLVEQMNMIIILIEFTSLDLLVVPEDVQSYYIDKDLVDCY